MLSPLTQLPDELLLIVFLFLDKKSLQHLSLTCKIFWCLCKDKELAAIIWPDLNYAKQPICYEVGKNLSNCLIYMSNGKFITGTEDGKLFLWQLKNINNVVKTNVEVIYKQNNPINSLALLPNNEIAIGCQMGKITIFNCQHKKMVKEFNHNPNNIRDFFAIKYLCYIPHAEFLAIGISSGFLYLQNINTGKIEKTWDGGNYYGFEKKRQNNSIIGIVSRDHKIMASFKDRTLRIWDIDSSALLKIIHHPQVISAMTPISNQEIAYSLNDEIIILNWFKAPSVAKWQRSQITADEILPKVLIKNKSKIHCLLLLSDKNILTTDERGELKIWDLDKREAINICKSHFMGAPIHFVSQLENKNFVTSTKQGALRYWLFAKKNSLQDKASSSLENKQLVH